MMNFDDKPKTIGQSDLVTGFIGHLAYIAVLPAERRSPWAACSSNPYSLHTAEYIWCNWLLYMPVWFNLMFLFDFVQV